MAGAVYWIGADGNAYVKSAEGVVKYTSPTGAQAGGFQGLRNGVQGQSVQATQIADPNAPRQAAPSNPNGAAAPAKSLNQGAVNNTQMAIDQIPALLQAALESEGRNYSNTVNTFNAQEGQQRKTYDDSTVTNQQNYDANFMDSIRAGVKGLGSLMQILRGTGAGGGTADEQVRDVVGGIASDDIRGGADTQKQNQGQLDTTLSTFLTDLSGKRQRNEDTRINNERAIRRDSATQLQDLYGKMAGFFGDADRVAERDSFMARAGAFTPEIAANSRTAVSAYDTTPVAVQAPQLTAFAAPSQPDAAAAPEGGQVGSGIFTISPKRREQQNIPVALPAGV